MSDRPERINPPTSDLTAKQMLRSITGWEELEIKKQTKRTFTDLVRTDESELARALVFIHERRNGGSKTWHEIMDMSVAERQDYWQDAEDEDDDPK